MWFKTFAITIIDKNILLCFNHEIIELSIHVIQHVKNINKSTFFLTFRV